MKILLHRIQMTIIRIRQTKNKKFQMINKIINEGYYISALFYF